MGLTLAVLDKKGSETEKINLPDDIFAGQPNKHVMHQAVVMYQACRRQGNASTKARGEVSGGGKKPYRQKGTGQSRAGSSRSPLWHGGGVTFGPHPRDFGYQIPKKIRKAALRESLKAKCLDHDLLCVEDIKENYAKTKDFAGFLTKLKLKGKILAVLEGSDESIARASRNIPYFTLVRAEDINAYDVLRAKKILVTRTALTSLLTRLKIVSPSTRQKPGKDKVKAKKKSDNIKGQDKG